jgi:hypothetical protein
MHGQVRGERALATSPLRLTTAMTGMRRPQDAAKNGDDRLQHPDACAAAMKTAGSAVKRRHFSRCPGLREAMRVDRP